jgi:hypothetical protein
MVWILALSFLPMQESAAEEAAARLRADEARRRCATRMDGVEGVLSVGSGGIGTDHRILVAVRDFSAKLEAQRRVGADSFEGVKIYWSVVGGSGSAGEAPLPAEIAPAEPGSTVAAPPQPSPAAAAAASDDSPEAFWKAKPEDCDILRDYLKMKRVSRPAGGGRYWIPCQLIRRSVVGPGGGHTYVYTKHRPDCPVRLGRLSPPAWADNFVAWVFRKGFTPVMRAGFTWPFELRGDDKLWDAQASGELKTRLSYIREAAEWENTRSGWQKVTGPWFSGWRTTGGHPGQGWTWRVPGKAGCPTCANGEP